MQNDAELSALERSLAACRPSADGLNADAMLFAAGRASARGGKAWPVATGVLAALSVALGIGLWVERSERVALAARLTQATPVPLPVAVPSSEPPVGPFAFNRSGMGDPDALMVRAAPTAPSSRVPPPVDVLRAWPARSLEP